MFPYVEAHRQNNPYYWMGPMSKLARGIVGHLIEERPGEVVIPFIESLNPGKGNCSAFIEKLTSMYISVKFPDVINPVLKDALTKRGFRLKSEYLVCMKSHRECLVWKK